MLTTASPKGKFLADALYSRGPWSLNLRERLYGATSALFTPDGANYYRNTVRAAGVTDLEFAYNVRRSVTVRVGADNLFNLRPPSVALTPSGALSDGSYVYGAPLWISPYGINGGYYYTGVAIAF